MAHWEKLLKRILAGRADANIAFDELRGLLSRLGYAEHIKGAHHIFRVAGRPEIIDIQPQKYGEAKAYQVRQVRAIFRTYGITSVP
jgi:hypothetical protein